MSKKPVLYYAPHSPPCRAANLAAAAAGVELDYQIVNTRAGEHLTPEFLKMNPQHTIPVLEDNGIVVTDSNVIATYLAEKYGKDDSLYPKDVEARNRVLARLFYNCGNLFARLRSIVEPVFYAGAPLLCPAKLEYLQKAYDGLEHCLVGNQYVCGDTMTVADLCLVATVSTAHDLAPVDQKKFPNILAWLERMSALPYYEEANRKGADLMLKLITAKLEENKKAAA